MRWSHGMSNGGPEAGLFRIQIFSQHRVSGACRPGCSERPEGRVLGRRVKVVRSICEVSDFDQTLYSLFYSLFAYVTARVKHRPDNGRQIGRGVRPIVGRTVGVQFGQGPIQPEQSGSRTLARLVNVYAKRLQIQEKMTVEIAACLDDVLKPLGVAVVIEAVHQCMTTRGVHKSGVRMATSRMLGVFRKNPVTRQEFLSAIGRPPSGG